MIIILPSKKENKREPDVKQVKSAATDKPKDWPFMEQSGVLLDRLPAEWSATDDIIALEYEKLANAETERQKKVALVRLASACLYEWRKLNA